MWQLSLFYIYLTLKSNNYHYNYYLHSGLSCLLNMHVCVCVCVCVFSCPMFKSSFSKFARKLSHISAKIKHCICFLKHYTKQKTIFGEEITHRCFCFVLGFPRTNEWMSSTKKKKKRCWQIYLSDIHDVDKDWLLKIYLVKLTYGLHISNCAFFQYIFKKTVKFKCKN